MVKKFLLTAFCFVSFSITANARSTSYPGGVTLMQHNDYVANSFYLNYTINGKDSVGIISEHERMQNIQFNTLQYTRVLKRWNQENSQGNLYLHSGVGGAEINNSFKNGGFGSLEADWENRRYYVAYKGSATKLEGQNKWYRQMARVGIAPYIGGYEDLQTWFILQVSHTPQQQDNLVTTPYLVEFGVADNKTALFNFMTFF